jgi:hypothetical protein
MIICSVVGNPMDEAFSDPILIDHDYCRYGMDRYSANQRADDQVIALTPDLHHQFIE